MPLWKGISLLRIGTLGNGEARKTLKKKNKEGKNECLEDKLGNKVRKGLDTRDGGREAGKRPGQHNSARVMRPELGWGNRRVVERAN